jgi:hypothetical protein
VGGEPGVNVDVKAGIGPDKSVTCDIEVDGRHAVVTFADGEITMAVPGDEGDVTLAVPESVASVGPAG